MLPRRMAAPCNALIHALTLDLDDTLWAVAPVIERAEAALHAFLRRHAPGTAERWPIEAMRSLRERVAAEHPQLAHDFTAQRRLTLRHALLDSGADGDLVEPAFEAFIAARNQVELYPDVAAALDRLSRRRPLAALTNGNADLERIGLGRHFRFSLAAREHGRPKPDPGIFLAACARLGQPPGNVLHVGDDPWLDVEGAARAGLATCWINRSAVGWPGALPPPDLEVATLAELADWIEMPPAARRH